MGLRILVLSDATFKATRLRTEAIFRSYLRRRLKDVFKTAFNGVYDDLAGQVFVEMMDEIVHFFRNKFPLPRVFREHPNILVADCVNEFRFWLRVWRLIWHEKVGEW